MFFGVFEFWETIDDVVFGKFVYGVKVKMGQTSMPQLGFCFACPGHETNW